jgi:hypothetical protein
VSARTGYGLEQLTACVRKTLLGQLYEVTIRLPLREGKAVDFLESRTKVLSRDWDETQSILRVSVARRHIEHLLAGGVRFTVDGEAPHAALERLWPLTSEHARERIPPHERLFGAGE